MQNVTGISGYSKMKQAVKIKACDIGQKLPLYEDVEIDQILHVNTINDFYFRATKDVEVCNNMEGRLMSVMAFGQDRYSQDANTQVALLYTADMKWRRVKILEYLSDELVKIRYIDYGHTGTVELKLLRALPTIFEGYPPFAIYCSMDVVPFNSDEFPQADRAASEHLRHDLCSKRPCDSGLKTESVRARCVQLLLRSGEICNVVKLHALGEDWGSTLLDCGYCKPCEFTASEPFDAAEKEIETKTEPEAEAASSSSSWTMDEETPRQCPAPANAEEKLWKTDDSDSDDWVVSPHVPDEQVSPHPLVEQVRRIRHPAQEQRAEPEPKDSVVQNLGEIGQLQTFDWEQEGKPIDTNFESQPGPPNVIISLDEKVEVELDRQPGTLSLSQIQEECRRRRKLRQRQISNAKSSVSDGAVLVLDGKLSISNGHRSKLTETRTGQVGDSRGNLEETQAKLDSLHIEKTKNENEKSDDWQDSNNIDIDKPGTSSAYYPFRKPQIVYPTLSLFEAVNADPEFRVALAHDCNRFTIVPLQRLKADRILMSDEINLHVGKPESALEHDPQVGDLVLGRIPSAPRGIGAFRALVLKKQYNNYYLVQNIDHKRILHLPLSLLCSMTEDILSFPIFGYDVILDGVKNDPPMILQSDVDALVVRLRSTTMEVIPVDVTADGIPVVRMIYKQTKKLLSDEIMGFREWPWKTVELICGSVSDNDVYERHGGGITPAELSHLEIPMKLEIKVLIRSVHYGNERHIPRVYFEPLDSKTQNMKQVLNNQMKAYLDTVKPSAFFPSAEDVVFICAPEGMDHAGEWARAIQVDPDFRRYCYIDTRYQTITRECGFKFRKMPVDFARIPPLVVDGTIRKLRTRNLMTEYLGKAMEKAFRKVFAKGRVVEISVEEMGDDNFHLFECEEFRKLVEVYAKEMKETSE